MGCPRLAAWGQAVLFLGGASGDSHNIFDSDHYLFNPAKTIVKSFIGWRVISKFSKTKEHAEASFCHCLVPVQLCCMGRACAGCGRLWYHVRSLKEPELVLDAQWRSYQQNLDT